MPDDSEDALFDPSPTTSAGPRRACGCATGPTRPRPATATSSTPASPTGPGGRSASRPASASARRSAPTARSASPSGRATERAEAEVVVTNHALLAIDAIEGVAVLPQHDVRDRRRGARAGRPGDRCGHRRAHARPGRPRRAPGAPARRREGRRPASTPPRRSSALDGDWPRAGSSSMPGGARRPRSRCVRDAARTVLSALGPRDKGAGRGRAQQVAQASVESVHDIAERIAAATRRTTSSGSRATATRCGRATAARRAAVRSTGCCGTRCSGRGPWC